MATKGTLQIRHGNGLCGGSCLLESMYNSQPLPLRWNVVFWGSGVGTKVCGTGRSALGSKLDRVRDGHSCSKSGCYASCKAVAASVGLYQGAGERLGFKSAPWTEEPSLLSFGGDPQGWRWGECTLFDRLAWIQIAAD